MLLEVLPQQIAEPRVADAVVTTELNHASVVVVKVNLMLFWVTSFILLILAETSIASTILTRQEAMNALAQIEDPASSIQSLLELAVLGQYMFGGLIGGFVAMIHFTPSHDSDKNIIRRLIAKWAASAAFAVGIAPKLTELSVTHWNWDKDLSTIMFWSVLWGVFGVYLVHDVMVPIFEQGVKKGVIEICHTWARRFGAGKSCDKK